MGNHLANIIIHKTRCFYTNSQGDIINTYFAADGAVDKFIPQNCAAVCVRCAYVRAIALTAHNYKMHALKREFSGFFKLSLKACEYLFNIRCKNTSI